MREAWSWREESNLQPAVYKTAALPIELRQPFKDFARLGQWSQPDWRALCLELCP